MRIGRYLYRLLPVVSAFALMTGCYSIDDTQKEWTDKGETIYVGRLDSLKVRSGMNRVEISGSTRYIRTAIRCVVEYNDESVSFAMEDIVGEDGMARMIVDGLDGGSYYFTVTTYDSEGNRSVPSEVYGVAYGENDLLLAKPRRISDIVPRYDGSVDLVWNDASSEYVLLRYEDADGKTVELRIEDDPSVTNVKSWKKGGTVSAQTFIRNAKEDLDELALSPIGYTFPSEIQQSVPRFSKGSKMDMGPSGDYDLTASFTVEMKVRFTEFAKGDQCVISCESDNPSSGFMVRNNESVLQFYVATAGSGWQGVVSPEPLELNRWYDISATYSAGSGMALYIDGAMKASGGCGTMVESPSVLQIGTSPYYSDRYLRGDVRHVSIWSQAKTADEISSDCDGGLEFDGTEAGLKAYWPLTVNYGDTPDITGTHTAAFTGVTWNPAD